jgi:glyoxylase-like metal-dependent hydrolase (beta-lactamase superfamily II)
VKLNVKPEDEIGPKLRSIGIPPEEVRWLILTHLHTDHAGGLEHFLKSKILVSQKEYFAASGLRGKMSGYLPNRWPDWFVPTQMVYEPSDGVFSQSYRLTEAGDVLIVPTPGHSVGHQSVILYESDRVVFFAGDVSYSKENLEHQIVDGVSLDINTAKKTLKNVHKFVEKHNAVFLPSHDPDSAHRLEKSKQINVKSEKVLEGVTT